MSTALTTHLPALPSAADLDAARNYAALMARFEGLPDHYRGKPQAILWAMGRAQADGVHLVVFMDNSYPLPGGRIGTYADYKLGLAKLRVPDFHCIIVERNEKRCVLEGWRGDGPHARAEYGVEQATRRGLMGKETYIKSPQDMFYHRATDRLVKLLCADAMIAAPSLVLQEIDEEEPPKVNGAAPAERSEAVVVPVAVATPQAPAPVAVPEDWRGRLLRAVAAHYGMTPPGAHKNAYTKFANAHADKLLFLANEFYKETGEEAVRRLVEMPPMDYERIARWLEARNEKRAGAGGEIVPSGGTEAAPAQQRHEDEAEPLPEPDEAEPLPEPEPEPVGPTRAQALARRGVDGMVTVLLACRQASKGEHNFVLKGEKSGKYQLTFGPLLKAIGSVYPNGAPASMWLYEIEKNATMWGMLAENVCDLCGNLGVSVEA